MSWEDLEDFIADTFDALGDVVAENATQIITTLSALTDPDALLQEAASQLMGVGWENVALHALAEILGIPRKKERRMKTVVRMLGNLKAGNVSAALEQAILLFDRLHKDQRKPFFDFLDDLKNSAPSNWANVKQLLERFKKYLKERRQDTHHHRPVQTLDDFLWREAKKAGYDLLNKALQDLGVAERYSRHPEPPLDVGDFI